MRHKIKATTGSLLWLLPFFVWLVLFPGTVQQWHATSQGANPAELHVGVRKQGCMHFCKFISERMCTCYLQQLKGSEQFPSCAVPSVNLVVLQLWWEPWGAVVLVAHLDDGLRKRPTYELCLTLSTALWWQAVETVRWQGEGIRHGCGGCSSYGGHLVSVLGK